MHRRTLATLVFLLAAEAFAAAPPGLRRDRDGDPLPPGAVARLGSARLRHLFLLSGGLAISPDGSRVASLDQVSTVGGELRVWDRASGRLIREIDPEADYNWSLAFTPDGRTILSGQTTRRSRDRVVLWDIATNRKWPLWDDDKDRGGPGPMRFSRDGRTLAILFPARPRHEEETRVRVYDLATRNERAALDLVSEYITQTVAVSPDGSRVIVGTGPSLGVWDVATRKVVQTVELKGVPRTLALSPDGKGCAVHWHQGSVTLVRLGPPARVITTEIKGPVPSGLAFSADGKEVLFAPGRGDVVAVDFDSGRRRRVVFPSDDRWRPYNAFTPDGRWLARGDTVTIQVIDTTTGKLASPAFDDHRDGSPVEAVPSPDGRRVATRSDAELRVWELPGGRPLRRIAAKGFVPGLRWSPDGKSLAVARPGKFAWYDAASGNLVREVELPKAGRFLQASLTADGKAVTWLTEDDEGNRRTGISDAASGKERARRDARGAAGELLAWSDDGKRSLWYTGEQEGATVRVQEAGGRVLWKRTLEDSHARAGFAGPFVVATSKAGVETWDVDQKRPLGPRLPHPAGGTLFVPLALSPDARTVVLTRQHIDSRKGPGWSSSQFTRYSHIVLLEPASGQLRHELPLQPTLPLSSIPRVPSAAFTSDGRHLITAGAEGVGVVWDVYGLAAGAWTDRVWEDLGSSDGRTGFAAVCTLVAAPRRALALLGKQLPPARIDAGQVRRWIADLDSAVFARRAEAERQLATLGEDVEGDLQAALQQGPPLEPRARLERLRRRLEAPDAERRRRARAVEALEQLGAPGAALLKRLAAGHPGSRLTREARAALSRQLPRPGLPPQGYYRPSRWGSESARFCSMRITQDLQAAAGRRVELPATS